MIDPNYDDYEAEIRDPRKYEAYCDLVLFKENALERISSEHPLNQLRFDQIRHLQRLSLNAGYKSVRLLLEAHCIWGHLIIKMVSPSHATAASHDNFPASKIIILNTSHPEKVLHFLHNLNTQYEALDPPNFKTFSDQSKLKVAHQTPRQMEASFHRQHHAFMKLHDLHISAI